MVGRSAKSRSRTGRQAPAGRREEASVGDESTENEGEEEPESTPQQRTRRRGGVATTGRGRGGRARSQYTQAQQSQRRGTRAQQTQQAAASLAEDTTEEEEDSEPSGPPTDWKELVRNAMVLVLAAERKKVPLKRSDFIKQAKFPKRGLSAGLYKLQEALEVFGLELFAIKQDRATLHWSEASQFDGGSHFLVCSKFAKGRFGNFGGLEPSEEEATKGALKGVLLNILYISGREVEEDYLWNSLCKVKGLQELCTKREDFSKCLKTELVKPMYIHCMEIKTPDGINYRYSWGIRAELECDKLELLKHLAAVYKKPIEEFKKLYEEVVNDPEYNYRIEREKEQRDQVNVASNSDGESDRGDRPAANNSNDSDQDQ